MSFDSGKSYTKIIEDYEKPIYLVLSLKLAWWKVMQSVMSANELSTFK